MRPVKLDLDMFGRKSFGNIAYRKDALNFDFFAKEFKKSSLGVALDVLYGLLNKLNYY